MEGWCDADRRPGDVQTLEFQFPEITPRTLPSHGLHSLRAVHVVKMSMLGSTRENQRSPSVR